MLFKRKSDKKTVGKEVPRRFQVARRTLFFDRLMTGMIIGGGLLVILSVLGIFLFIFAETLPLFGGAQVTEITDGKNVKRAIPLKSFPDEKEGWIYLKSEGKGLYFYNKNSKELSVFNPVLSEGENITAARKTGESGVAIGTDRGRAAIVDDSGTFFLTDGSGEFPVCDLALSKNDEEQIIAAICGTGDTQKVVLLMREEGSSEGETRQADLTGQLDGVVERVALYGYNLVTQNKDGSMSHFSFDDEWEKVQTISSPLSGEKVTLVEWIFGGNSILVGGEYGSLKIFSIYPQRGELGERIQRFGETKSFPRMNGMPMHYVPSEWNRSFFVASDKELRLCYSTTGETRWKEENLPYIPEALSTDGDFRNLMVTDDQGRLHRYGIDDRHPEAGMTSLFGKVWYEGYSAPQWQWQSVGGSDYEPKLSLIPLIFGTFKGTLYALLFALPIALLAAVYTAGFMPHGIKRFVKPTMEIMASLPSVVLGFLGALYIAPLIESKVPALICMGVLVLVVTAGLGYFWSTRSISVRNRVPGGLECLVLIPVILIISWACWNYVGDWIEPWLVRCVTIIFGLGGEGQMIQTFPDLWRSGFGLPYEQRNSLVVGFVMGFAVIPVIFTIAEDALSNVPASLIHASEALGASRWQVVRTIVLPVASGGILSALMIGFGRAVGETMIVLMATGNTPVMDWNIFNGMRTLSANIATELPEAAVHSTHYRVLFLCGFLLFIITFILNTAAEILRTRLKDRYKSA